MKLKDRISLKNKDGAVIVIVAICLTAIMGVTALAIDVGSLYRERRHLQTVADSAALAGAQELPKRPNEAINKAYEYAEMNGLEPENIKITITDTGRGVDNDKIIADVINPESPLYFGRIFGNDSSSVPATASATANSPLSMSGLMPWTIPMEDYPDGLIAKDVTYDLKVGPDNLTSPGFFQIMAFDGMQNKKYTDAILKGCEAEIELFEYYPTKPGNIPKLTYDAVNERISGCSDSYGSVTEKQENGDYCVIYPGCSRVVFVPLINERPKNPSEDVQIIDFAIFFIEGVELEGTGAMAFATVKGKFADCMIAASSGDVIGYKGGLKIIRLVK